MLKLKILALLSVIGVVGIVLSSSLQYPAHAEDDPVIAEIASYKTWNKITAEPIQIGMDAAVFG